MWEYEFKALLSDPQAVRKKLEILSGQIPEVISKKDLYFGRDGEPRFRIRQYETEGKVTYIVTSKVKTVSGCSEISRETEFSVDNPEAFCEFASFLGYRRLIEKKKKTTLFRYGKWNLEWNEVGRLGYYLEAEYLSEEELPAGVWESERMDLLQKLEMKDEDLEIRPYTQLLAESEEREKVLPAEGVIEIYSDGGCRPNPGAGAWAFVLLDGEEFHDCGGEKETTNNRMELTAAIEALEACARRNGIERPVRFHIDSQYVKNGITSWIDGWKAKGWISSTKEPVKNVDLWKRLDVCNRKMKVEWVWIKGHAGNDYNEICDTLCTEKIREIKKEK
ncbi:MAG: ribonuclease HI [Spirochaetia bacterium]|nr:ribonuclease HI [Spirochaetia bacterium]